MDTKKLIAVIAVIVMVAGSFVAAAAASDDSEADGGKLVVETSPDFAPFDYLHGSEYAGIDMDIVRAVASDMGYSVEFRNNSFDSIVTSVQQHKCDIGASGFTITDERKELVNFSDTYATVHQVAVVLKDSGIHSMEDVKGKTLTVQTGTSGADYAETIEKSTVVFQKTYNEVILDVINKRADAEIVDNTVAYGQVAAHPELEIRDILAAPVEEYGFVFAKDRTDLLNDFNESFQKLKDNGLIDKILRYYESNNYAQVEPYDFTKKSVTIETSPDFPPYEYMLGMKYVGIDMDIMRAIADNQGWNLDIRQNNFDSIILSVQQGKCDIGASGFTISDERKQKVDFSDSYASVHQVIVVKSGSDIDTLSEVYGKKIAVQTGTSGAAYAETVTDKTNITHQTQYTQAVLDVINENVDLEVVDNAVAEAQVAANSGIEIRDILDAETEYYGFIVNKDKEESQELLGEINEALGYLKSNGTIDKIVNYYAENGYDPDTPSYFDRTESKGTEGDSLWDDFKRDFLDYDRYEYVITGLENTLKITVLALIMGMVLGALVAMVRSTHQQTGKLKIANGIATVYVTVIRGTPMMVQLLIIYYVVFASVNLNQILIASVAFGINSGAYVAEVFRSGINAVPKGQMEACRSLGMNNRQAMKNVVMPQALRNILPALGNEGISLLKETSVAGYIGVIDLTRAVDIIRGQTYDALVPLLVAAAIYLAIVLVLAYLIKRLERRLNNAY